jgi:hypothetical protein
MSYVYHLPSKEIEFSLFPGERFVKFHKKSQTLKFQLTVLKYEMLLLRISALNLVILQQP